MTIRCPHCYLEISPKEIVAQESWKDDEAGMVRDVVLLCPGCAKPLTPAANTAAASRSM